MQNVMIGLLLFGILAISIDRLTAIPQEPVRPLPIYFSAENPAFGQLDKLIANSIRRQREINDQLDRALEIHRKVTVQLRNYHHNP